MARISNTERGVAYPKLAADDLNLMIGVLAEAARESSSVASHDEITDLLGHLIGFYTRRWGLPPVLVRSELPAVRQS